MVGQIETVQQERKAKTGEPWELEYVHHQLPTFAEEDVSRALNDCKTELQGTTDRKKLLYCVRRKLG